MASINKLTPGQVLYTVTRHKMGNTTISTVAIHSVKVISIAEDGESVVASWNGNAVRTYHGHEVAKWRTKKPMTVDGFFGSKRLASREEIAKARETGEQA